MSRLTFLYQMDLPHRAVAVYTYLYDRANTYGECWPSVNTIAGDIKYSKAVTQLTSSADFITRTMPKRLKCF